MTTPDEPDGLQPEHLVEQGDLEGALLAVAASTRSLDGSVRTKIAWTRAGIVAAGLVGLFGTIVGAAGLHETRRANRARDERSVATCEQYNAQERRQASAEKAEWRNFIDVAVAQSTSPGAQRFAEAFVDGQNDLIDKAHQPRDCSPSGIDRYLEGTTTTAAR